LLTTALNLPIHANREEWKVSDFTGICFSGSNLLVVGSILAGAFVKVMNTNIAEFFAENKKPAFRRVCLF
jgi:hypothetical protein